MEDTSTGILQSGRTRKRSNTSNAYCRALERLVTVVQELSPVRDLGTIMDIVGNAARGLTGADGTSFVLREGDVTYYADENAISPLWKGRRFPLEECIAGWAILNRQTLVIEDIYADARIPKDLYRPTFVKSLVVAPIRKEDPIGAIGIYWARRYKPDAGVVKVLQTLADTTSVAMENVQLYAELERRVRERTTELEESNSALRRSEKQLKRLSSELLKIQEKDMKRIANEIHDSVGQSLYAIKTGLQGLMRRIPETRDGAAGETFENLIEVVDTAIEEVRTIYMGLWPSLLDDLGILAAMKWFLREHRITFPEVRIEKHIHDIKEDQVPERLKIVIFRILQTAMDNVARHSKSDIVRVTFRITATRIELIVEDNGIGFSARDYSAEGEHKRGLGLAAMQERVESTGGIFTVKSVRGEGTTIHASWDAGGLP